MVDLLGQARHLSKRLIDVQEQERANISRGLHDEIGQNLTTLKFTLESGLQRSGTKDEALVEAVDQVADLIREVREFSNSLHPSILDDFGLEQALIALVERYSRLTGVDVEFSTSGMSGRLPKQVEVAAYRIVQESLTNIARYAKVKDATVTVSQQAALVRVEVRDTGVGIDPRQQRELPNMNGGLAGIVERAELLGGKSKIESSENDGTAILVELPT